MKTSRVLSAISFGLIIATPACSGKFASLGDIDAGLGGNSSGTGGSSGVGGSVGVGGSSGVTCLYNNVNYAAGSSFKSSDGCNTCSCSSNGQVACTLLYCLASGGSSGTGGSTSVTCVFNGVNYPPGTISANTCCICGTDGTVSCANNTGCNSQGTGGSSGVGGATGTSSCVTAADCHGALPALCEQCTDGSSGCAHFVCNSGSCDIAYCDNVTCLYNGVNYANGSSFELTDGCNTCSCTSTGSIVCTERPCPVGSGGASSVGGAGQGGSTSCPAVSQIMPKCSDGTAIMKYDATTGCPTGYGCPTCPAVNLPNITCADYQLVTDPTTGCPTGYVCPTLDASTCPPIALVVPSCTTGTAILKYDPSTGCATGYGCP